MKKQHQIFFDFLRFSIGLESEIPSSLKEADWKELYRIAQKQCLAGILFDGIQKLPPAEVGMSSSHGRFVLSELLEVGNLGVHD